MQALGSANDNGLSVAEEAARRICEGALEEEKAALPRYAGESWIVLYRHLLMLRGRLTFDQLVGHSVEYRGGDKAAVQGRGVDRLGHGSQAICGNHIMRAGKHWATFTSWSGFLDLQVVGVVRPLPGWETRGLVGSALALLVFTKIYYKNELADGMGMFIVAESTWNLGTVTGLIGRERIQSTPTGKVTTITTEVAGL